MSDHESENVLFKALVQEVDEAYAELMEARRMVEEKLSKGINATEEETDAFKRSEEGWEAAKARLSDASRPR